MMCNHRLCPSREEQAARLDQMIDIPVYQPSGGEFWYVVWGEGVIVPGPRYGPPKPYTLHDRWSQRVNWWLADLVGKLRGAVYEFAIWLKDDATYALVCIEQKLEGYDDL